jgi:hypothetical protein
MILDNGACQGDGLVRRRQTKGLATDRLHLNHRASPRLRVERLSHWICTVEVRFSTPVVSSSQVVEQGLAK